MPIERHQNLITVAGVRAWMKDGLSFECRYDMVSLGQGNVSPSYNCIYLKDGKEFILVASNTRTDGSVEERKIRYWPGVARHHAEFGDGSKLFYDPVDNTITTWLLGEDGRLSLCTTGKNKTPDASDTTD